MIFFYAFVNEGPLFQYAIQVIGIVLIGYLLWRVETLSELSIHTNDEEVEIVTTEHVEDNDLPLSIRNNIGLLLQRHCIDELLYLQNDLTLQQLATAVGTNRSYLSQYFSCLGMNYNTYINNLRINHFMNLYRNAVAAHSSFTAQQLAYESGYHNYRTFSNAFKHKMGQTVTFWMKAAEYKQDRSEIKTQEGQGKT